MAIWKIKERNDLVRANEIRGSRGFFMGGTTPSAVSDIYQLDITSTGNAVDFGGNLQGEQKGAGKGCNAGSAIRIIYGGGSTAPAAPANGASTQISHFTPIHSGNAADFGDLTLRRTSLVSLSNNTRALFGGGYDYAGAPASSGTNKDIIDFITIQSLGNAVDFGDLQQVKQNNASCASTTRGVWAGGHAGGAGTLNQIDFVTIASAGNAADFGDLSAISESFAGSGSNIKGIVGGGNQGPYAGMDVITIASTGGGTDFGDLTQARRDLGSTSNQIRQVFGGGAAPGITNIIDFLQIASLGNASDFGDLAAANRGNSGSSVSHNGLELGFLQRPSVTYMPGSGRAFTMGGQLAPGDGTVDIDTYNIQTLGNTRNFGDLIRTASNGIGTGSSRTRAICLSGYYFTSPYYSDMIQSFEMASEGNAVDFGNAVQERYGLAYGTVGNTTRGVFMGGYAPGSPYIVNNIDFLTFATMGNASDFGDLTNVKQSPASASNNTRGLSQGGTAPSQLDIIDYVTIASAGNATDFGDSTLGRSNCAGAASSVRAVQAGGGSPGVSNVIDYVTIASTGDASDFGDLTQAGKAPSPSSDATRAVFAGRHTPSKQTTMDYITIASTGNAADFGDLKTAASEKGGMSDSHAGLQG